MKLRLGSTNADLAQRFAPLRSACHKGFSACPTVACSISTIFSPVKTSLTEGTDRGLYISSICSVFCSITKHESGIASLRPSYNFARHSFVLVTTLFSAGSKSVRLLSIVGLVGSKIRNYKKKTLLIKYFEADPPLITISANARNSDFSTLKGKLLIPEIFMKWVTK